MRAQRSKRAAAALLAWVIFAEISTSAFAASANESQIKAAFIYKFCLYVDWPAAAFADANTPLIIAIAGPAEMVSELREVTRGRKIAGRSLAVVEATDTDEPTWQVLYVVPPERPTARSLIARARGASTLLITENIKGIGDGSVINFTTQENRIRFDIDLEAAAQQGLHIGAQLLQVARSVHYAQGGNTP